MLIVGSFLAYSAVFFPLNASLGPVTSALVSLPVILTGWWMGQWGGLLAGLFAVGLNVLLLNAAGSPGWDLILRRGGPASLVVILFGAFVGRVSDMSRQLYEQVAERKRAEKQVGILSSALEQAADGVVITDRDGTLQYVNPAWERMTGYAKGEAVGRDHNLVKSGRHDSGFYKGLWDTILAGREWRAELVNRRKDGRLFDIEQTITPVFDGHGLITHFVAIERDVSERKWAEAALRRRAAELEALTQVSLALREAGTVEEMMPILLKEATELIGAALGIVFLIDPETGDLVARGWHPPDPSLLNLRHRPGEGITGHVALSGEIHIAEDLSRDPLAHILPEEAARLSAIHSIVSVPLRTRETIIGVMHVGLNEVRAISEIESGLLIAIAGMAGNAIHRAALHEQAQRDAAELAQAYGATIEGWGRALELRDRETEGHTRRVTLMTVTLARAIGLGEDAIVHVRRGALLHDIGKMGVPDSILLKPGPLTDGEWAVMRRHPAYAHEMLSPIGYLRPALDIPYCHHERWDGTGYPRGLRGEQIPLAARIFAVADVWDALTSDRPYRSAWSEEAAWQYIREQAGMHFAPRVVEVFCRVLNDR